MTKHYLNLFVQSSEGFQFQLWLVKNLKVITPIRTTRKKMDKLKVNYLSLTHKRTEVQGKLPLSPKSGERGKYRESQLTLAYLKQKSLES